MRYYCVVRKASTTSGSNWLPEHLFSSASAETLVVISYYRHYLGQETLLAHDPRAYLRVHPDLQDNGAKNIAIRL